MDSERPNPVNAEQENRQTLLNIDVYRLTRNISIRVARTQNDKPELRQEWKENHKTLHSLQLLVSDDSLPVEIELKNIRDGRQRWQQNWNKKWSFRLLSHIFKAQTFAVPRGVTSMLVRFTIKCGEESEAFEIDLSFGLKTEDRSRSDSTLAILEDTVPLRLPRNFRLPLFGNDEARRQTGATTSQAPPPAVVLHRNLNQSLDTASTSAPYRNRNEDHVDRDRREVSDNSRAFGSTTPPRSDIEGSASIDIQQSRQETDSSEGEPECEELKTLSKSKN